MSEVTLDLNRLYKESFKGITHAICAYYSEAAKVCLDKNGFVEEVRMSVSGNTACDIVLMFGIVNNEMRHGHSDLERAVEDGAYGVSILIVNAVLGYKEVKRARKGGGFDFWIRKCKGDDFQNCDRLEVSGILSGKEKMKQREKEKIDQVSKHTSSSFVVIIVEFGAPCAKVVIR